jgi:O-antigen ligase
MPMRSAADGTRAPSRQPAMALRRGKLVRRDGAAPSAPVERQAVTEPASETEVVGMGRKALIVLFLFTLFLPYSFAAGPLRLTPVTMFLLAGALPFAALWAFSAKVPNRGIPDALIAFYAVWASLALVVYQGFGASIEPIGTLFVQAMVAFAAGRVLVRGPVSAMFLARVLALGMIVLLPMVVAESVLRRPIFLELASFAGRTIQPVMMEPRMGLRRAQVLFEHPILFGIFTASLLSFVVFALRHGANMVMRWLSGIAIVLCSVLTLSTGALLSLNTQFGLWLWRRLFRDNPARWKLLGAILLGLYVVIDLISVRSPFHVFVNYATFSSGSSYNRILIWEFGTAEVARHPLFGIGLGEWERPRYMSASMDNFWLVQAVRYGLPAFLALAGALILLLVRMASASAGSPVVRDMRSGLTFSLLATAVAIGSVHLWNNSFIWLLFLMGCSGFLAPSRASSTAS